MALRRLLPRRCACGDWTWLRGGFCPPCQAHLDAILRGYPRRIM